MRPGNVSALNDHATDYIHLKLVNREADSPVAWMLRHYPSKAESELTFSYIMATVCNKCKVARAIFCKPHEQGASKQSKQIYRVYEAKYRLKNGCTR